MAASECLGFVSATVLGGLWSLLLTSYHLDSPRPPRVLTRTHQGTPSQDPGFCSHEAFDLQIPAVKLPMLPLEARPKPRVKDLCANPGSYSLDPSFFISEMGVGNKMLSQVCSFLPMHLRLSLKHLGTLAPHHPRASLSFLSVLIMGAGMLHPHSFIDPFTLVLLGLRSREAQRTGPLFAATKLFGSISNRTI